ncbi:hypothetical protein DSCO28_03300 [Desulfosarcina ovata subsp. sediminis]|uniref:Spore protein YkvP/CgeB glycosyl transferase-like domain-containing protein n=1 Tax=Desulfosarcina ovata subsp. sediminis TaxID=885957 RepID=A0A5K7ZER9_9BACT|nr:hypothetical protein DSCO28_03300 [Desulfosarcina ovata subsp. sediminis]
MDVNQLTDVLNPFLKLMGPNSQLSVLYRNFPLGETEIASVDMWLGRNHLIRYNYGRIENGYKDSVEYALIAVSKNYNPVMHARQIASAGSPALALDILDTIPAGLIPDIHTMAKLNFEGQKFCLMWQAIRLRENKAAHSLYFREHRKFAQVTALSPNLIDAYRAHAKCFKNMGRDDLALRVMRSIQHAFPDKMTAPYAQVVASGATCAKVETGIRLPVWQGNPRKMRILVITHNNSDYGMDTLYHGLCNLLGKQNVIEFPWKPTLHGQCVESANNYPCVFHYPGEKSCVKQLVRELKAGRFDLIIYADVVGFKHQEEVRQLLRAAQNIPLILYDTWDDCYTPDKRIQHYIGGRRFDIRFKREFLLGANYESKTLPLPFSFPERYLTKGARVKKTNSVFWAGKKIYGLRPLYIPYLEKRFGWRLDKRFDQQTYQTLLRQSHIGLSFCGCGFDTVRYWELPANGVMIMSERLPIGIPYNFTDGESAVFFDDLKDMEDKLDYYLRHFDEAGRISDAGHRHYLRYHTSTARARQFLGAVCEYLGLSDAKNQIAVQF